ncbi:related to transport protein USO1 [Rhynchosporium agropyri]|uniref:Related to transport protein USO1 n=1 Tax=Rhynchosporium agropyri TaxID=914238 RepID=A0A1E1LB73_9HELO|nr:related to transport protein USO1 [Rhynchosporium agropyri]
MPSMERSTSRDSDRPLKHQHSASSDCGRAIVPMWDSSDPERAPPPLPMNPSSPVATSRPNTSTAIQSAHLALTEKARESGYVTNSPVKRIDTSPERSLIKGAAHKRMQSLQTGNVRDLSSFLEGGSTFGSPRSPEKSTQRPSTPHTNKDFALEPRSPEKSPEKSPDRDSSRSATPTPGRETPNRELTVRPSLRRPAQSILGENTPPQSATMLALQNMTTRETDNPLSNVTNGSTALVRTPQTFDAISNQILSLTSIATSLQREMAQLSRRSKDNATDLVSLKEATNARDEDIRKSLRDLVINLSESSSRSSSTIYPPAGLYLDSKAHISPGSRSMKPFSLPRIPSPTSFAASLERESMTSASSYNHDGVASIALLEKILREMGTKEGQESLVSRLTEVAEILARDGNATAQKLDALVDLINRNSSQELVTQYGAESGGNSGGQRSRGFSFEESPRLELDFETPRSGPVAQRGGILMESTDNKENMEKPSAARASEIINDDVMKIIRTIKDSVAQGGGLTAEVKALVRELRGEVLGMGREIGRKLDEESSRNASAKDVDADTEREHISRVVQDGLEELKVHMDQILREHRRQSASSMTSRNTVDYQEIYNAVRSAVNEKAQRERHPELRKQDIIEAVKEAWENYKPESELQLFGLEREELLTVLKEGIQEDAPKDNAREFEGATREEVFTAIVEGLKHFSPPQVETEASLSREEILDAVRECLEEFEFPSAPPPEPIETGTMRNDMLDAVKEGLSSFEFPSNAMALSRDVREGLTRDDILEAVREVLDGFEFPVHAPESVKEDDSGLTRNDMLDAVREGLHTFDFPANGEAISRETGETLTKDDLQDALKECLQNVDLGGGSTALTLGAALTRDDIFDAVKAGLGESPQVELVDQVVDQLNEILECMHTEFKAVSDEAKQNVAAHGRDTEQLLDATKDGFEKLRSDIETYVDRAADINEKDELLDRMRDSFDSLRMEVEALASQGSGSSLGVVQTELENLRETMSTSLVRGSTGADKDEILNALKAGLDSLRADIERPKDSSESILSGTGEILDALHDGLSGLRDDVEKISTDLKKPVDMTVNYEILDTLKLGLEVVRADIDRLRESGHGDQAVAEINSGAVITVESLKRNDIENLEVLITQLRIKVEALESMPLPPSQPAPGSLSKDDLHNVEEMLRNVQETMVGLSSRERSVDEDGVKREDVEAIETLLRNTKAKIDDMDPEQAARKDHIDAVELLVSETRDGVHELATHLEDVPKREDINVIEGLVRDVLAGLEEMKDRAAKETEDLEKVTKTDVEAVEAVCLDVKTAIEQIIASDIAALPSKSDFHNLEEMIKEFKGRIELHEGNNAKAFEERQAETVGVGERVSEVKSFLEEFKDALKLKLDESATNIEALGKLFETLGETLSQNEDVKEMFETMKTEFEKSNAGVVGSKLESDEKFQQTWDKFDFKLDEKFNELMTKYDDAQIAAEIQAKLGEDRNATNEAAVLSTKVVAEELKVLIDTLGPALTESVEKMDEASKTVFSKVEDTFARVEETHADAKADHQLTRDEVYKTLTAIDGVQVHASEYNPKILESINDVLLIVGQHYEHSKTATVTIQEKIAERPAPPDMPLLAEPVPQEKYDDSPVHEKLDKLVDHMHVAGKSFAQLDALDKIHKQVMDTAAEVSAFVTAQTQRIADDHEDREKAVEAATIALEKRLAQKEHVEATVVGLREEEERLKESVAILKAEQDDLSHQKMRLSADVSSMETALRIRREELHAMEARAEGLERRILEGVIDHSRALLISKSNKGRDAMSRKRVPSHAPSTPGSIVSNATSRASQSTQSAVSMAMNGNRALVSVPINNGAGASRRILSLNQITHNVPTGGFKRSHSVKAPGGSGALRKSSWGGSLSQKYGDLNKENLMLKESEEDDENLSEGDVSDSGTMRRSSRGTTVMTTTTGTGTSESIDEGTEWSGSMDGDEYSEEGEPTESGVVLFDEASQVA